MDIKILGGLLKRIDNFNMSSFKGRLILQKTIYLLEKFGINLGYNFSWYVYGPYCPHLTDDGFELEEIYIENPEVAFIDKKMEGNFNRFKKFIWGVKNDTQLLELLASILYLKEHGYEKDAILKTILNKQLYFTKEKFNKAHKMLSDGGLI